MGNSFLRMRAPSSKDSRKPKLDGFFLDDERFPKGVSWCAEKDVNWHRANDFLSAVETIERLITGGKTLSYMSLDFDLGEFTHANPRTGVTFFKWFEDRMKMLYEKEPNSPFLSDSININIHSQSEEGSHQLRQLVGAFERWFWIEREGA